MRHPGGVIQVQGQEEGRAREAQLIRKALEGDVAAFEQLYRENVGRVYALCFRLSSDPSLAEELTQDVFVRAWQKLGSFRGESAFSSWLYPLTVNVALTERRSRVRRTSRVFGTEDPTVFEKPEAVAHGPRPASTWRRPWPRCRRGPDRCSSSTTWRATSTRRSRS